MMDEVLLMLEQKKFLPRQNQDNKVVLRAPLMYTHFVKLDSNVNALATNLKVSQPNSKEKENPSQAVSMELGEVDKTIIESIGSMGCATTNHH